MSKTSPSGFILVPLLESRVEPEYSSAKPLLEPDSSADLFNVALDQGVVRINNVMSPDTARSLRALILDELEKAKSDHKEIGESPDIEQFSRVLSSENRWDFRLKLFPEVELAMQNLLAPGSAVGDLLEKLVLSDGKLFELGAFVTINGASRQDIHSDTKWSPVPAIYTCLFALQDISPEMGPTVFFPATQTKEPVYSAPLPDSAGSRVLEGADVPFVLATLSCGDAAVYDSRTLHCGGGNRSDAARAVFYFSFTNAAGPLATDKNFWNVTSILPDYVDKFRLADFRRPRPRKLLPEVELENLPSGISWKIPGNLSRKSPTASLPNT